MSNIKILPGGPVPDTEPVKEVVEILEEYLEAAKNGSLRSIAITGVRTNKHAFTSYTDGTKNGAFEMLGAMEWLKDRILTRLRDSDS